MAESNSHATAPAVDTPIESGRFDEKETKPTEATPPKKEPVGEEEEEDEDIVRNSRSNPHRIFWWRSAKHKLQTKGFLGRGPNDAN
jgi:hypothetical protein